MRRIIMVTMVAASVLLAGVPAEAARKAERGPDFANERGTCRVATRKGDALVTCDLDERTYVHYRFRLPRGARHVRSKVDRDDRGCCGSILVSSTRYGTMRRHLVVEVRVHNYGNPLGEYKGIIHGVEVRYWSARA